MNKTREQTFQEKVSPFLMLSINSTTVSFLINEINLNPWKKQNLALLMTVNKLTIINWDNITFYNENLFVIFTHRCFLLVN